MANVKDYKDSSVKTRYKSKVTSQSLTKVTVDVDEKRSRAELLDSIETLFVGQQKRLNSESLRAILHILVKSVANSSDDEIGGAAQSQILAINANTSKTSFPGFGTSSGTSLEGNTALLQLGTTSTTALAGDTTTISASQANAITANTAKTGITTSQADAIVANTAKTGISTSQASAITANTAKVSQGLATANHTMQFDVAQKGGKFNLVITIFDASAGGKPVVRIGQVPLI